VNSKKFSDLGTRELKLYIYRTNKVRDEKGNIYQFKVTSNQSGDVIGNAIAELKGVSRNSLRLRFDGQRVNFDW
jgi:hypothetical protein